MRNYERSGEWYIYYTNCTEYKLKYTELEEKGDFYSYRIAAPGTYVEGLNSDSYWYEDKGGLPKYTLCKYDDDLTLKSTYDVDTKVYTSVSIDISNKGRNKVKLTLDLLYADENNSYEVYISNDGTTWQRVENIISGKPKELDVNGWNELYIKLSRGWCLLSAIDVSYYKN